MSDATERPAHDPADGSAEHTEPSGFAAPSDSAGRRESAEKPASAEGPVSAEESEPDEQARGAEADADADAWSTACAEDLAAERVRRRAGGGREPGSAAEEFLKLVDAVGEKLSEIGGPLLGPVGQGAAQQAVRQVVRQAKAAVEPVVERNPQVFDHLAAAGSELLAAYRSAVSQQESRWTRERSTGLGDRDDTPRGKGEDPRDDGPGPGERIDLD